MTRDLLLLAAGALLVVVSTVLATVTRLGPLLPNAVLPLVIYLGMASDISLARGALLAFLLGLFVDAASGHAMGTMTFVHVATLIGARAAGFRLIIRGRLSQVLITAVAAAIGALIVVALLRVFRPQEQLDGGSLRHTLLAVLAPSLTTGAIAPFVFRLVRRLESLRRRDESAGLA